MTSPPNTEGRLRRELDKLHQQLAEVKHVDDQELDKLWLLAGGCNCKAAFLRPRFASGLALVGLLVRRGGSACLLAKA